MKLENPLKRVQRLRRAHDRRERDSGGDRLPPGQVLTRKFPVLSYGRTQKIATDDWELRVWGLVENPITLNWQQLMDLPQQQQTCDIHCVTRWSKLDTVWQGVPFQAIADLVRPLPNAEYVMQHSYGDYTTNLSLAEMLDDDVLLAHRFDDHSLTAEHGGPLRMLVPKLYFWKSAKWLNGLEFMAGDRPGFWEMYGYHMHGDPWLEERFS